MNALEVLLIAWAADVTLERHGDEIRARGIKPHHPPELIVTLRNHKQQLLAFLVDQDATQPKPSDQGTHP